MQDGEENRTGSRDAASVLSRNAKAFAIYNRFKARQCLDGFSEEQAAAFRLIPYLLHTPGFGPFGSFQTDGTPCGIHGYRWDPEVKTAGLKFLGGERIDQPAASSSPALEFLSLMGSIGSIAYTDGSDLDFWCCVRENISQDGRRRLQAKLEAIERWCESELRVQAHFFITTATALLANDFGSVSREGCGSALGGLLKEEYFRGSLLVSGKTPYWWIAPPGCSDIEYMEAVALARKDSLFAQDYIDIGNIVAIPQKEIIGGSLWQLNKSIESPFKSVLKLALLLEYSDPSRENTLLATELKKRVQLNPNAMEHLDSYQLMMDRVLEYFEKTKPGNKLELLRRCFFLKVRPSVLRWFRSPNEPKRHVDAVMLSYCRKWGWSEEEIARWERFEELPLEEALALKGSIEAFLMQGLRMLQERAASLGITQTVRRDDFLKMIFRLKSAFGSGERKCDRFYPPFDFFIRDRRYTLRPGRDGGGGWELYRGLLDAKGAALSLDRKYLIKAAPGLSDILVWLLGNGLIQDENRIFINIPEGEALAQNLRQLAPLFRSHIGVVQVQDLQSPEFSTPPHPLRFLLCVNCSPDSDRGIGLEETPTPRAARSSLLPAARESVTEIIPAGGTQEAIRDTRDWLVSMLHGEAAVQKRRELRSPAPARHGPEEAVQDGMRMLSPGDDPMNAWGRQVSLMTEAFLFERNSWGEVSARTFTGCGWLAAALARIMDPCLRLGLDPTTGTELFVARWHYDPSAFRPRLKKLLDGAIAHFLRDLDGPEDGQPVYLFRLGGFIHMIWRQGGNMKTDSFRTLESAATAMAMISASVKRPAFDPAWDDGLRSQKLLELSRPAGVYVYLYQKDGCIVTMIVDEHRHVYLTTLPAGEMPFYLPKLIISLKACMLSIRKSDPASKDGPHVKLSIHWITWDDNREPVPQAFTLPLLNSARMMEKNLTPLRFFMSASSAKIFLDNYASKGKFCLDTAAARKSFQNLVVQLDAFRKNIGKDAAQQYRVFLSELEIQDDGDGGIPASTVSRLHLKTVLEEALTLYMSGRLVPDAEGGFDQSGNPGGA